MTNKVFVYGSLRKGFGNHRILGNSPYLGDHLTEPFYTMLDLGAFPGVILGGITAIRGEVYEVDDETFKDLDGLEGYPRFYTRIQIDTPYGEAWMYVLNPRFDTENYDTVGSGDWRDKYVQGS